MIRFFNSSTTIFLDTFQLIWSSFLINYISCIYLLWYSRYSSKSCVHNYRRDRGKSQIWGNFIFTDFNIYPCAAYELLFIFRIGNFSYHNGRIVRVWPRGYRKRKFTGFVCFKKSIFFPCDIRCLHLIQRDIGRCLCLAIDTLLFWNQKKKSRAILVLSYIYLCTIILPNAL